MSLIAIRDEITRSGHLPAGQNYWLHNESHFGRTRSIKQALVPGPLKNDGVASLIAAGHSKSVSIGDAPDGFEKGFTWDRQDDQILLVAFVNAADPLGVEIANLKPGDIVKVTSATGIASFTQDTGNPLAQSLVSLLAAGAEVGTALAGIPLAIPIVNAAERFANEQFKTTQAKHKLRDAFGVDPGSGHKVKQEGGVIVCLPESNGTWYSGNNDHKDRWIKAPGDRVDLNLPAHIHGAFFVTRELARNTRTVRQSGEAYVLAWDHRFEDNAGYYKIFIHISKGPPKPIVID